MTDRKKLIQNCFILFMTYFIGFIWMPFPKSIIGTIGNTSFVFCVFTSCIWFVIFSIALVLIINSIPNHNRRLTKKIYIKAILITFIIQLLIDITKLIGNGLLKYHVVLLNDFSTVLGWLITVLILCKLLKIKIEFPKRFICIYLPCVVLFLTIVFILDLNSIENIKYAQEKYVAFSNDLTAITVNADFKHSIRNFFLDYLSGIVVLFSLYKSVSKNIIEGKTSREGQRTFVARIIATIILSITVCCVKVLIIPYNAMTSINVKGGVSYSETFHDNSYTFSVYRLTGYKTKKVVYCGTKVNFLYGQEKLLGYSFDGDSYELSKNSNRPKKVCDWMNIDGFELIIGFDKAAVYKEREIPSGINFNKLPQTEYNEIVLNICKYILEDGRFECFEYVGEYVARYDFEFAKPYIERYAEGDFTNEEIVNNSNINLQYITKTAQSLHKKTGDGSMS